MTASDLSNKASTDEVKVNAEPVPAAKNVEAETTTKDETDVESPSDKSSSTELTVETITDPSATEAVNDSNNNKEDEVVDVIETSGDQASTPVAEKKTTSPKKRESPTAEPEGQPDAKKTATTPDDIKTISLSMEEETKKESDHEEKKDEESSHQDKKNEDAASSDQVAGESTKTATNKDLKAISVDVEETSASAIPPSAPMVVKAKACDNLCPQIESTA
jgi:hypothetical protein